MTTSPTFTNRRIYRGAYALAAFQSASPAHTPVSDFSAARSLWGDFVIDPGGDKVYSLGAESRPYKLTPGRFLASIKPTAMLRGLATPKSVETALRSCLGSWSSIGGGQFQMNLTRNLNEYATLGLVESKDVGSPMKFIRAWDMWAHRVSIHLGADMKEVALEADWIGRDYDRTPMNSLGGITLPLSFAPPGMIDTFAPHSVRLFRDPAGANVSIAVADLDIEFEQGFSHEHWNDTRPLVEKVGYTSIRMRLHGSLEDENYAIITDAETKLVTYRRFTATFTAASGKVLSIDMSNVDFTISAVGWRSGKFFFDAVGEAFMDDGTGSFVTIVNTP